MLQRLYWDETSLICSISTHIIKQNKHVQTETLADYINDYFYELTHSIFLTHYTTKAQPDGHGLGLSILKSTVEKYNGTITLSNTYPEGSDTPYFCIEISV